MDARHEEIESLRGEIQALKKSSEEFQAETRAQLATMSGLLQANNELLLGLHSRTRDKTQQKKDDEMTLEQARAILKMWQDFMDKPTSSDEESSEEQANPQFEYVKTTGISIEGIVEEEPAV